MDACFRDQSFDTEVPTSAVTTRMATSASLFFVVGDVPPALPSSPFFTLSATTLRVASDAPHELGLRLLGFLRTEVVASITKISREKFAVKAEVYPNRGAG